jgi:hypothetical protein
MRPQGTRVKDPSDPEDVGRSYYRFCLFSALNAVLHARALVAGDVVDSDHELPEIERLLREALEVA